MLAHFYTDDEGEIGCKAFHPDQRFHLNASPYQLMLKNHRPPQSCAWERDAQQTSDAADRAAMPRQDFAQTRG